MNKTPDFIAELHYLATTAEAGRNTPALSGYFPQTKFDFSHFEIGGKQKFIDKEVVYPGDDVTAEITLLESYFFHGKLDVNMVFEFKEGSRAIGTGKIIEILNEQLLAK